MSMESIFLTIVLAPLAAAVITLERHAATED